MDAITLTPIPTLNPILLGMARHKIAGLVEKRALIPGGADPSMGGGAPPPPDHSGGMGGAAVPPSGPGGDQSTQIAQQVTQMMAQGGGAAGKGKSPKDQIMQGQMKILMHLVAQLASKAGIQVDPQLLVPATDPSTDQMAMQELQNSGMAPSNDPNAPPAGQAQGAQAAGPAPIQPMDASSGPIGKTAGFDFNTFDIGTPFPATNMPATTRVMPEIDAIIAGAHKTGSLAARTRRALGA